MKIWKYIVICLSAACLGLPAQAGLAAEALLYLPGGGTFTKPVTSFKEARLRQMVPQSTDYSCGAASLASILQYYYGLPVDERRAMLGMLMTGDKEEIRQRGFSMLDMKRYAMSLDFQAEGFTFKDVEALKKLNIPAIVLIDTRTYKHFVVIRKVTDDYVYLADPSWGNRRMRLEDFAKAWNENTALLMVGKMQGSPAGLLALDEELVLPKHRVLRYTEGRAFQRLPVDPSTAMLFHRTGSSSLPIPVFTFGAR